MTDVFLSYSRTDRSRVSQLVGFLEQQGYSVWSDVEIPPTGSFDDYIRGRLNECKCVVVVWSRTSARSIYVRGEAREAYKANKLISVAIDPLPEVEQGLPVDFHSVKHADLSQWKGEADNHEIGLVLKAIENLTARPPQITSAARPGKKFPKRHLFVATTSAAGLLAVVALYIANSSEPAADCRVEVTVERLIAVPAGVNIDFLEIVGASGRQRVPVSPTGRSVLQIADGSNAFWRLNIRWNDDVESQVGPYDGCPDSAQHLSPDGRASVSLRAR